VYQIRARHKHHDHHATPPRERRLTRYSPRRTLRRAPTVGAGVRLANGHHPRRTGAGAPCFICAARCARLGGGAGALRLRWSEIRHGRGRREIANKMPTAPMLTISDDPP